MAYQNRRPAHPKLKVLIVCRQRLICEGLRLLVQQDEDITIAGTAPDAMAALKLALRVRPDIVILVCLDLSPGATLDVLQQLFDNKLILPIIIVALDPPITQVCTWVEAGVFGIIPLDAEPDELLRALYAAGRGERTLHPTLARRLIVHLAQTKSAPSRPAFNELTPREYEVLTLMAQGACDKDIAQSLFISVRTVQTHLAHIYEKLGVHSRTEAALLAIREGWVELPAAEAPSSISP